MDFLHHTARKVHGEREWVEYCLANYPGILGKILGVVYGKRKGITKNNKTCIVFRVEELEKR